MTRAMRRALAIRAPHDWRIVAIPPLYTWAYHSALIRVRPPYTLGVQSR